jgi:protocatechuate 3,4-dioxygenase beta subunit
VTLLSRACAIALLLACAAVHAQQAPPPPPPPAAGAPQPTAPAPPPASLSGRVVAADTGQPVRSADIRLSVVQQNPAASTLVARTDDDGRFELTTLPAGAYLLQVTKAGFVLTSFGLPGAAPGVSIRLSASQHMNLGDLKLPRGGVIAGQILDEAGDPIAEVVVTAERLSFLTPSVRRVVRSRTARTDDLGGFRIHGLNPGKYYVSARPATQSGAAPLYFPGVSSLSEATPVEVRAGEDSAGIALQLRHNSYGVITGTVTDSRGAPFAAANVWLVSPGTDGVQVNSADLSALTDADGHFKLVDVSPGEYRIEAFSRVWMDRYRKEGERAGPPGELGLLPVSVTRGETQVTVRMSPGFRVTGQVLVDGTPLSGAAAAAARVSAAAQWGASPSAFSIPIITAVQPDGTFALTGVHGLRLLGPRNVPGLSYHHTIVGGEDISERGIVVTADVTGVEIHLTTRPSRLDGTVVDAAGKPVADARVVVFSAERAEWMRPGFRRHDNFSLSILGKFTTSGLPAGNYLAAIVADEDSDRWADPDYLDSLRPHATPFTINDAATTTIVLTKK